MSDALVTAAARAHALVGLADGRLAWPEEHGFASVARRDPAFSTFSPEALEAASATAIRSIDREATFAALASEIAALLDTDAERQAVMRVARAALAADGARREQEDDALRALAIALNLDPDKS